MFDLNRLRALRAVATHGSVTGAAAALGYTPSAVSQQIAKLERETGSELLDRQGGKVELTPAAWLLAEAADEVVAVLERTRSRLEEQRDQPTGRLVLAAFPTACRGFAAAALAGLARGHRALDCRLVESDPQRAIGLVVRGEADLAVVHDWHNTPLTLPPSLSVAELGEDIADAALPAGHPLADREVVTPYDLRDERWIGQSSGAMCHEWLVRSFAGLGIAPDIAYQVDEYASQVTLLAAGLGVTMLPRLGRAPLPPTVRVIPMQPAPSRQLSAVWRSQADRRPAIHATLAALRAHWPGGNSRQPPREAA
ncbi:LysR family transcriptional regulator [Streptomyces tubercidicus]|uniref:LysR family transcriptional regulator n=1 Tax=Streptomyces tubercidicus TaxID=47759 RepID=A0A640UTW5_9ACTN|nr:LysR family transcriptional regulator [Streptomyces tubercidicus]WAU13242.1 LysR family transcriptional regulator [Streptomyces tubercidicus]GFE38814.1 LysR family transcriptional regulator [Streptomyces tubercidicus]